MTGAAYGAEKTIKYILRSIEDGVTTASGLVTDAFNEHVSSLPKYSRRLEMEFPIVINGTEHKTLDEARQPLKDMISEAMGVEFQGDVTTDAKIAIHGEYFGPNILQENAEPTYVELHFRDADTLSTFVENAGLDVDYSNNQVGMDGNNVNLEGNADLTILGFTR
ncbi:MAG: hypothetical protein DHS20C02_06880 [Micavibrio sp.]|nr:MAG: hypothetical protein DHS20C02_06880 [Micavibrio sp.]